MALVNAEYAASISKVEINEEMGLMDILIASIVLLWHDKHYEGKRTVLLCFLEKC